MSRTGRGRGRARAEVAVVRVLEKRLGALPVVAEFGRRLRIAEIVDQPCPVRPVAWISHGEVMEALVANRLTAPAPWSPGNFVDTSIMPLLVPNCQIGARNPLGLSCRADVVSGRDCNIARCSRTRRS